ncbi:MAG TPA: hypothetical protein VII44_09685 [Puia sp.]
MEMSMNHIRLYDLFRKELHLSDDKAADFVMAVEDISGLTFNANKELLATKNDIHLLDQSTKKDIHSIEQSIRKDIHDVDQSIRKDIHDIEQSIRKDLHIVEQSIRRDLDAVDQSIRKDFYSLEQSIRKEIQQSKEDTYKAIFLAGFVQFIAILGSVLAIIKFMK